MSIRNPNRGFTRRDCLKAGTKGVLLAAAAGSGLVRLSTPVLAAESQVRLLATDGFMSLPGRRRIDDNGLYVFGFRGVNTTAPGPDETFTKASKLIAKYKGKVTWPAPILGADKDSDCFITLTNLGLEMRPDLDDSHTIHWHGFRNPNAIFDGVPEVSISVPVGRDFPYYFKPRDEGTYMYHCHFEDVEHVQMGMDGIVYIKATSAGHAYDQDSEASTAFHRQFTLLLNEVDTTPHDNLLNVQEFTWSDYKAKYWVINGRSYPDTVLRDQELPGSDFDLGGGLYSQPVSSLIQVAEGETALLRFANLGYEQQSMQMLGIPMTVVGQDASYLGDNAYVTNSVYIGPGEARDVLFTAPAFSGGTHTDAVGDYDRYWLRNRNGQRLVNGTEDGLGGQVTEVRVYDSGVLGIQPGPNKTI